MEEENYTINQMENMIQSAIMSFKDQVNQILASNQHKEEVEGEEALETYINSFNKSQIIEHANFHTLNPLELLEIDQTIQEKGNKQKFSIQCQEIWKKAL